MAGGRNRLTANGVAKINKKGRYADGGGLYLRVSPSISKSWVFRWVRASMENEIGLGGFPDVSLANARTMAAENRRYLSNGRNPRIERDRVRNQFRTFGMVADAYLAEKGGNWTNEKTRWQWSKTLNDFADPIRRLPVADIGTAEILGLLRPIWQKTPETAAKSRMRLEAVLDYAKANGFREGENPARWRGHLSNILPARKPEDRKHFAAMPYEDIPAFFSRLQENKTLSAQALKLLILTACRTSEVLKAEWSEFDLNKAVWTIPPQRMKTKQQHTIPLTDEALKFLTVLHAEKSSEFIFPGRAFGKPLSQLAMEMLLRRMDAKEYTVHGFRSTFRDWCGDKTSFPREVAEMCLSHKVGDKVEQAYRRSTAIEKRRALLQAWAAHCTGSHNQKVVRIHG